MLPQDVIRKKRDGQKLTEDEISFFIKGIAAGNVSEGQVSAFCMATLLQKMDASERVALTRAMAQSGTVLDWSTENLDGPVLDKHSTGGVGDKVSLMLAPMLAACGAYVPMISGRGLGHTGGTLDKMDAIAGYVSQPSRELFRKVVREAGCAIIGATPDLAPADRVMYAVRDVTSTVESLDLITASILSKKLAAGLQGLVMDVKFGSGAFMRERDKSEELARTIADVATGAGLPTVALMTDMNTVLGHSAGNAVEVIEAVEFLTGKRRDVRLLEVTLALCAELLVIGKLAPDTATARAKLQAVLDNGKAAEYFARMVVALGGPADILENPQRHVAQAKVVRDITPKNSGKLTGVDVFAIGMAIVEMGGGRRVPSDKIDFSVGLTDFISLGSAVGSGQPLCRLHAKDQAQADFIEQKLLAAITLNGPVASDDLVLKRIAP